MSDGYGFELAVCAEMVFRDEPFERRVHIIRDLGFSVEIWNWTTKDIAALAATGARFTSMTGYVEATLLIPGGRRHCFAQQRSRSQWRGDWELRI
jgi:hydroxypyruvate isomerase